MNTDNTNPVVPTAVPDSVLPTRPPITMLEMFCLAIRDYEGKPGDLNYLLNNPGDCRPSPVGYLPEYEPVIIIDTDTNPDYPYHVGKFAKFPTYAIGWLYLTNLVHYYAVAHPTHTIAQFFANYAPSGDANNPNAYAQFVAKRCGVSVDNQLKELFG